MIFRRLKKSLFVFVFLASISPAARAADSVWKVTSMPYLPGTYIAMNQLTRKGTSFKRGKYILKLKTVDGYSVKAERQNSDGNKSLEYYYPQQVIEENNFLNKTIEEKKRDRKMSSSMESHTNVT